MNSNLLLKDYPLSEKPRERLIINGAQALSDAELLAILISTGGKSNSAMDVANNLVSKNKSIRNILESDIEQLKNEKFIGNAKAATLKAVHEISKRVYKQHNLELVKITKPKDVYQHLKPLLLGQKQEHLFLVSLNSRQNIISKDLICIGSISETLVPIREIFRKALLKNAEQIILVHNHPSNDPTPSAEDILVTQKIAQASKVINIPLLDHLIFCDTDFVSIKSLNIFETNNL